MRGGWVCLKSDKWHERLGMIPFLTGKNRKKYRGMEVEKEKERWMNAGNSDILCDSVALQVGQHSPSFTIRFSGGQSAGSEHCVSTATSCVCPIKSIIKWNSIHYGNEMGIFTEPRGPIQVTWVQGSGYHDWPMKWTSASRTQATWTQRPQHSFKPGRSYSYPCQIEQM